MSRMEVLLKYDGADRPRWSNPHTFGELASVGIVPLFADSFLYKDQAYLAVGHPRVGKTSSVGRFVGINNRDASRLSEDTSILEFEGPNTYIYCTNNDLYMDLQPVICSGPRYVVNTMFYLRDENDADSLDAVLNIMFGPSKGGEAKYVAHLMQYCRSLFERINLRTLPPDKTSVERYRTLKKLVDESTPVKIIELPKEGPEQLEFDF